MDAQVDQLEGSRFASCQLETFSNLTTRRAFAMISPVFTMTSPVFAMISPVFAMTSFIHTDAAVVIKPFTDVLLMPADVVRRRSERKLQVRVTKSGMEWKAVGKHPSAINLNCFSLSLTEVNDKVRYLPLVGGIPIIDLTWVHYTPPLPTGL